MGLIGDVALLAEHLVGLDRTLPTVSLLKPLDLVLTLVLGLTYQDLTHYTSFESHMLG